MWLLFQYVRINILEFLIFNFSLWLIIANTNFIVEYFQVLSTLIYKQSFSKLKSSISTLFTMWYTSFLKLSTSGFAKYSFLFYLFLSYYKILPKILAETNSSFQVSINLKLITIFLYNALLSFNFNKTSKILVLVIYPKY